jgi:hypothetical protein
MELIPKEKIINGYQVQKHLSQNKRSNVFLASK